MDIKDIKHAEEMLINLTQRDDIKDLVNNEIELWDIDYLVEISELKRLILQLYEKILPEKIDNNCVEALEWLVYDKIHDDFIPCIRAKFYKEDLVFFEKCQILHELKISAEQFGANENYTIPLSAAVVELSVLDKYKSPTEKMNCLCSTYDLVFAEIKTAIVSVISQNSEKENEIPVIDNCDIIPVLMVVIVKSRLVHMFSNLFYIQSLYYKMEEKRIVCDIFKAFETAADKLMRVDLQTLQPTTGKMIQHINLEEYIKITSSYEEENVARTLVAEANQRILNLITRSTTDEDQTF